MAPDRVEGTYYEPFVGGGALFFALAAAGRLRPPCGVACDGGAACACPFPRAVLGDANEELMHLYRVIRDDVEALIGRLVPAEGMYQREAAVGQHRARAWFLALRADEGRFGLARAARTVLINKLGFNGLYRVNKAGNCNVPFGKKGPTVRVFDPVVLRAASAALQGVVLRAGDFQATLAYAPMAAGSFVMLDSPYGLVGVHDPSVFAYGGKRGFGDEHARLVELCGQLDAAGVRFILTNRDDLEDTNRKAYREARLTVTSTSERRSISRKASTRKPTDCLLVTNPERRQLKAFSVCSGSGHFDYGLHRAGIATIGFCEIEPYARKVLARHWAGEQLTVAEGRSCVAAGTALPTVPIFDDLKRLAGSRKLLGALPDFDVLVGGIPCQGFSLAGSQKGRSDARWLWPWFFHIVKQRRPTAVIIENVTGLRSSEGGAAFGQILRDLVGAGYNVEWDHIPAGAVGAPHIRDRIFIVGRQDVDRRTWLAPEQGYVESAKQRGRKSELARPGDVPHGGWPRAGRVVPAGPGVGVTAGLRLFVRESLWPKTKKGQLWPWQAAMLAWLGQATGMVPTPRAEDSESSGVRWGRGGVADTLSGHVRLWPTPRSSPASLYDEDDDTFAARNNTSQARETLPRQARLRAPAGSVSITCDCGYAFIASEQEAATVPCPECGDTLIATIAAQAPHNNDEKEATT